MTEDRNREQDTDEELRIEYEELSAAPEKIHGEGTQKSVLSEVDIRAENASEPADGESVSEDAGPIPEDEELMPEPEEAAPEAGYPGAIGNEEPVTEGEEQAFADEMIGEEMEPSGEAEEPEEEPDGEMTDVEMESPEEALEADEENEQAQEEADDAPDLEADEAAGIKAEEAAARKAQFDALPVQEKVEAEAAGLWKRFCGTVAALWKRVCTTAAALWKTFRSWKTWQQAIAIVVAVIILVGGTAYAYFHSKYILMDISDGVSVSTEFVDNDDEDEEISAAIASREESGELVEAEVVEATGEIQEDESIVNILLIGTDERSEEFSDDSRGDTCMLVSINRSTGKISLVSFERATGVKIPSGEYEGQWDWLTHTFWYGGADMMMQVIRDNYRIDVDKYIRVNICTFMELIEAVGGVDVELTEAEADVLNDPTGTYTAMHIKTMHVEDEAQHDLVEGMNHLNGATAMLYVRLRAIDDDWHRVVRQRNVIMAIAENFKSLSLTELNDLLDTVLPLVQTNLTEADIASLLTDVPTFLNMDFESITFPLDNTYGLMDGMSGRRVYAVDFETNSLELQRLLAGEVTADELEEKYENLEGELEDYSYKDSEEWQENYIDAETIAGKYYSSYSGTTSAGTQTTDTTGTDTADTGETGETVSADTTDTASLGEIESVSTDPDTGIVTYIYYNSETGVRTAVAVNPQTGATVTATDGTESSETTDSSGVESTAGYDASAVTESAGTTDTTTATATGTTDTTDTSGAGVTTDTTSVTDTSGTTDATLVTDTTDTSGTTDTSAVTDTTGTTDATVTDTTDTNGATDTVTDGETTLTGNAAAEAYAAALAAAAAAAADAADSGGE